MKLNAAHVIAATSLAKVNLLAGMKLRGHCMERAGLHLGTVRKLENAQMDLAWRVVCALARGLGADLNTLGAYTVNVERTERPRGRPRKEVEEPPQQPLKKPRGRPRKGK
jgi:hypothetical protein